jgi:5-deoxy-glucuronate isomerase
VTAPDTPRPLDGVLPPHVPAGAGRDGGYALSVTPERAGWGYSGLRILDLPPGGSHEFGTGEDEYLVLPLSGGCRVSCDGERLDLAGRDSVFTALTDFGYLPRDARVRIESAGGGRFALPAARARRRLPVRHRAAGQVAVELRGAGSASRQVNNFCSPEEFEADRLIAVEVLTPAGNWSSYPPHKHDEQTGTESALEEIYYFEVAGGGPAYQRVYGSGAGREIDVCAEVRSGDAVLIPYGYHGPSMAAPGYHLYYLNVMAGPGERVWRFCDDPGHAWIRGTWAGVPVDPRLPLSAAPGEPR